MMSIRLVGLAVLSQVLSCTESPAPSESVETPATCESIPHSRLHHEAYFAFNPALRAHLDDTVIVRVEGKKAKETPKFDTGEDSFESIPYNLEGWSTQPINIVFSVDSPHVRAIRIKAASGATTTISSGDPARMVTVNPEDFSLEVEGEDEEGTHKVFVAPTQCQASLPASGLKALDTTAEAATTAGVQVTSTFPTHLTSAPVDLGSQITFVGAGLSGPTAMEAFSLAQYQQAFTEPTITTRFGTAVQAYFANGGQRLNIFNGAASVPGAVSAADLKSAIAGASSIDVLWKGNTIVVPDAVSLSPSDYLSVVSSLQGATTYASFLLDPPSSLDNPADFRTWFSANAAALKMEKGAMFYPFASASVGGSPQSVGLSASVAGLLSASDRTVGIWASPSSTIPLAGVTLSQELAPQDASALQSLGVNAVQAGEGSSITLAPPITLDPSSVNFKRLAPHRFGWAAVSKVQQFMYMFVFDGDAPTLWPVMEQEATHFIDGLFQQGAFPSSTEAEAYQVAIGLNETMTSEDVLNGIIVVHVGLAMTTPSQFVPYSFSQQQAETGPPGNCQGLPDSYVCAMYNFECGYPSVKDICGHLVETHCGGCVEGEYCTGQFTCNNTTELVGE